MTLTQTAVLTKQSIKLTIIALIVITVSFIGYKIWYSYYLSTLPPVEEKPDTKFGKLPPPNFPKTLVSSSNFSYNLDTTTGSLPKIGDEGFEKIIKVYFVIKPLASLLSSQRSQSLAEKFDITNPPQILSETNYSFRNGGKTLNVDLDSGNFTYINLISSPPNEQLDDDNKLVTDFKGILATLGVLKSELREGRSKVTLLKKEGTNYIPTTLRTEATSAQISLWPKDLDKRSIFTSDFNKSLVNARILSSSSNLDNYLSINFTNWPVEKEVFATYPTKSPEDAFNELKGGKGAIILEPAKGEVSITSIYLGYYLSDTYSPYLHPIYIFEGPQFVAYVSAIDSNFVEAK